MDFLQKFKLHVIIECYDHFCHSTLVSFTTFSFCQTSDEQTATKLVHALNDTHNTDLFPDLGKFLFISSNQTLETDLFIKLFRQ